MAFLIPFMLLNIIHFPFFSTPFVNAGRAPSEAPSATPFAIPSSAPPELQKICKTTRFPDVCTYSFTDAPAELPGSIDKVVIYAINSTLINTKTAISMVAKMKAAVVNSENLTVLCTDCLEELDYSLVRLESSLEAISTETADARAWMSSARFCLHIMEMVNDTDENKNVVSFLEKVSKMNSNALSMLWNMVGNGNDTNKWDVPKTERDGVFGQFKSDEVDYLTEVPLGWGPSATVSKDGRVGSDPGNVFKTVQEAIDAAAFNLTSTHIYVINITEGVYDETLKVKLHKNNIKLIGQGIGKTIIIGKSTFVANGNHEARIRPFDLNLDPTSFDFDQTVIPNSPLLNAHSSNHISDSDPCLENEMQEQSQGSVINNGDNNTNDHVNDQPIDAKKMLNNYERGALYQLLLQKSKDGKLTRGVTKKVAIEFSVSMRTVQRIWKQAKNNSGPFVNVSHRKTNCGRKRVQVDLNRIRAIHLHKRTTFASLACAAKISQTTLFRKFKSGEIRRHSNAIKPHLKEENKILRLKFCISMLERNSLPHDPTFIGMHNIIHIDEKWFFMSKKKENYYLLPDEDEPIRTCKSKNFIGKVMFLAAIARPRYDAQGNELFSGKIGIFPFITLEPAKRTSANRVAGTLETKPITSVNREIIKSYLLEKVLPAIKSKWPREDLGLPIYIQQDNARTHVNINDDDFRRVASEDGFDIRLMCQPPNSPDLNILDLGFFNGIQSLQYKEMCMIEIMKARGSHHYKLQHLRKAALARECQLPNQIKCDPHLLQEVLNHLH
ncbi:hypothetical protein M5689_010721 [Euphorbia peplus]|nr:hypothetical protein M5689_010721 [Euphorbia peplus]